MQLYNYCNSFYNIQRNTKKIENNRDVIKNKHIMIHIIIFVLLSAKIKSRLAQEGLGSGRGKMSAPNVSGFPCRGCIGRGFYSF